VAAWLDQVQMDATFDPFKRIYICNEQLLATKIRTKVQRVHTELLQEVHAEPQYLIQETERRGSRPLREAGGRVEQVPAAPGLSREFDLFKANINQNYSKVRRELDGTRGDMAALRRYLVWVGAPAVGLCLVLSLAQISLWLLLSSPTTVDAKASPPVVADTKPAQGGSLVQTDPAKDNGTPSSVGGDDARVRLRELGRKLADDKTLSPSEISDLRRLLPEPPPVGMPGKRS
jgi:hypothetical protein